MTELAQMLADMGVEDALNLDGGGSSTMLAREPGEQPAVVNQPSDGLERDVPDGLGWDRRARQWTTHRPRCRAAHRCRREP